MMKRRRCLSFVLPLALSAAAPAIATPVPEAADTGRDRLIAYLTDLAHRQTAARAAVIAAITTPEEARLRQVRVHAVLSDLIHFEHAAGPVPSEVTGTSDGDGFGIENLWYESMPGYRVTADLYRPDGAGPFPAIIVQPGHGIDGKIGDHGFAANLARAGFVVLSIDIVGEGERVQNYDPEIGASKVGRPTGQHSMAFGQALPTGGHVSRFFIQDAVRGVDYLISRRDVDDRRIGAFGCSGGGTMTAYLAALDPRIRATAVACYINDFDHLLAPGGPGPQDGEQSIPFFLARGLDLPDWIEAAAPRPYAIVSTTGDMFPIEGARAAYREARRFYEVMGAGDRITMIEGPGGHGHLGPIAPEIVAFFTRWLKGDAAERPFVPAPVGDPARLLVTPTGQLSTSGASRSLQAMIATETPSPSATPSSQSPEKRIERLRADIRDIARTTVSPGDSPPTVSAGEATDHDGYRLTPIRFETAPGLTVNALYARSGVHGPRPTLLLLSSEPLHALAAAGGLLEAWARAGWNVLALEPRGAGGTEEVKSPLTGDWTLLSLRALLVGKTPVGMRTDDALSALNWLAGRTEVDPQRIDIYGIGALGPVALHVGVVDPRVRHVTSEASVIRYRDFVERPISRDMAEVNLPGVLARYDLPDLIAALDDRLTLVSPVNAVGEPLRASDLAASLSAGTHLVFRSPRDPIPPPSPSR